LTGAVEAVLKGLVPVSVTMMVYVLVCDWPKAAFVRSSPDDGNNPNRMQLPPRMTSRRSF